QSQPPAAVATPEARDTAPAVTDLVLDVPTIHCQGCVDTIQAYLLAEDAIDKVEGDPKTKTIRVCYRPDMMEPEAIEKAINRLGHKTRAV
ncbi:MAG: heavy-metal-associated domain-containing protein, partial [Proteobacteria bacterium]|nr:heavy-metal-associated domain-containing protein [Pseudomonadota bacterium]